MKEPKLTNGLKGMLTSPLANSTLSKKWPKQNDQQKNKKSQNRRQKNTKNKQNITL